MYINGLLNNYLFPKILIVINYIKLIGEHMEIFASTLYHLAVVIIIFLVLTILGKLIYRVLKNKGGNSITINELLPEDEVHTLVQVFYLILMALCVVNIFYSLMGSGNDLYYFAIFDIVLSLYFAITLDMSSWKNRIIWLILVPYGSLVYPLFGISLVIFADFIHAFIFIYFAKINLDKFVEYTNSNALGITIILLFAVIFAGFFITQYSEGVNALDSIVIVSNQFTGNGYSVFGNTISGKLNSLLLVWGGYILSGVGAATLTAALLIRHFKKEFEELRQLIEEGEGE